MNKSESISKLSAALVKAQAEMKPIVFDAVNPFLKNKYATLGAVVDATRPILAKYGLAITQFPVSGVNQVGVTTVLLHESGEFVETSIALSLNSEKGKTLAQEAGSVITYLRRYSWVSILGLYAEEDTDGGKGEAAAKQVEVEPEDSIWGADAVQLVINTLPGYDEQEAQVLLDLSDLPIDATQKTITSWLNHVSQNSDKGLLEAARAANEAYKKALKSKK